MKVLITGNPNKDFARVLGDQFPDSTFISRSTDPGLDLSLAADQKKFAEIAESYDLIILNSALFKFNQTVLLNNLYRHLSERSLSPRIICVGSTTDRVKKATDWLYNVEKKALRDHANSLSLISVWKGGPKVSLISFGTLDNNQHKHPERRCMPMYVAAKYVKWLADQPPDVHINELSIDPVQYDTTNKHSNITGSSSSNS